jgi:hypothetical protein
LPQRDWSLVHGLLADVGADLARTDVISSTTSSAFRTSASVFVLPDQRVFFLAAATRDRNPVEVLEWEELKGLDIERVCGPLYDAALKFKSMDTPPAG